VTSPLEYPISTAWEQEGQRIAPALNFRSSALVLGSDAVAAAEVALGIGRAQARRRRVAVADVVGELRPIEELLGPDVQYGLMDAFFQGVSLKMVAQPADSAHNLLLLPSGTPPIDHEGILASPRWHRLSTGFRDAGALLLVIAQPRAPGLESLLANLDGVVLVGDVEPPPATITLAQARVETMEPADATPLPPSDAEFEEAFAAPREAGRERAAPAAARPRSSEMLETVRPVGARPLPFWLGIGTAALVAIVFATWAVSRFAPGPGGSARIAAADSAAGQTVSSADMAPETTPSRRADSAGVMPAASTTIANPADSAAAAAFGVAMVEASGVGAANARIEQDLERGLVAVTYAPERGAPAGGPLLVIAGAYTTRATADSLLRALRAHGVLRRGQGHVVSAPLALLVQENVSRDQLSFFTNAYHLKGLPVYGLLQANGSVNLYAGAFETIDQAQPLSATFRSNGEQPRLAYRIGRPL